MASTFFILHNFNEDIMEIETYENAELAVDVIDGLDEMKEIVSNLNLEGQKTLVSPENNKRPNPYRYMNDEERFVYSTLFPKCTRLTEYKDEIVPLRILQVASHFMSTEIDGYECYVMSPERAEPDPVLIARRYGWGEIDSDTYILARWGDCLENFEILRKKAYERAAESISTFCKNLANQKHKDVISIMNKIKGER